MMKKPFQENSAFCQSDFHFTFQKNILLSLSKTLIHLPDWFSILRKIKSKLLQPSPDWELYNTYAQVLHPFLGLLGKDIRTRSGSDAAKTMVSLCDDLLFYHSFYKELNAGLKYNPYKSAAKEDVQTRTHLYNLISNYSYLLSIEAYCVRYSAKITPKGLNIEDANIALDASYLSRFFSLKDAREAEEQEYKEAENINGKVEQRYFPIIVYLVTCGWPMDEEIGRLSEAGNIYESYMLNAIGGAFTDFMVRDLMAFFQFHLLQNQPKSHFRRISPGYGDWNIKEQRKIFDLLQPANSIQPLVVKLTESYLMIPEKSTSGVMGVMNYSGMIN